MRRDRDGLVKCIEEVHELVLELASPLEVREAYPNSFEADCADVFIYNHIAEIESKLRDILEEESLV